MRVGVIGTGWGLMHVGAFRAAGAEVVALCGNDLAKTEAIALRERVPLATTIPEVLVDAVDVVVVASPDAMHCAHVMTALDAGKSVLCEKPLAATLAEATAMAARARSGPQTAIVFPYRVLPPLIALNAWVARRPLRLAVTVRSGFAWTSASADLGGTSHVLDAVCWLVGSEVVAVQTRLRDGVSAFHLDFANGSFAAVTFLHAPEAGIHGGWSLVGDGFEAGFGAGYVPARGGWCVGPVRVFEAGAWRDLGPALTPESDKPEPWAAAHQEIARRFLAAARDASGPAELATFDDGLRVQAILHAIRATGSALTP